jgi:2'-5' RNA ligase
MFAIASLFDPLTDERTRKFWDILENNCGLSGIKLTPYPHFSWLSAQDLKWTPVRKKVRRITTKMSLFKVYTAGIGIFTGRLPIIYISLVKTEGLFSLHQRIWKRIYPDLVEPNGYYSPDRWIPHITIGYGDVNGQNLPCAIEGLLPLQMNFEIDINNISVIFNTPTDSGIKEKFLFGS